MRVFFYGLFMDVELLSDRGVQPTSIEAGWLDGFALEIGERATLVERDGSRAHGLLMEVPSDQVHALYADASVSDYRARKVLVTLRDGSSREADCYNLPEAALDGVNPAYATKLLELARRLDFPPAYLEEIRGFTSPSGRRRRHRGS